MNPKRPLPSEHARILGGLEQALTRARSDSDRRTLIAAINDAHALLATLPAPRVD